MTAVLSGRDNSAGQPDEATGGKVYVLDDVTKQLVRELVGDGGFPVGPEPTPQVDWEAIWSLAVTGPSEEMALGSAVLAAREALDGDPLPAPSALLARSRPTDRQGKRALGAGTPARNTPGTPARSTPVTLAPSTPVTPSTSRSTPVTPSPSPSTPVTPSPSRSVTGAAQTAPEVPKRLRRAMAGATWVRNLGIIIVLFAAWQLWGTGIAEAHSQSQLGAQYERLVQAAAAGAGSSTKPSTTLTSAAAPTPRGPVPGRAGRASVGPQASGRSKSSARFRATVPSKAALHFRASLRSRATLRGKATRQARAALHFRAALRSEATRRARASLQAETRAFSEGTMPGGVLGHLQIPAIGVSDYFVEGVGEAQLQEGPGRYPGTGLPGQDGNLAIAGHRTTYGAPFFRLGELRVGDLVIIDTPEGRATYRVSAPPFAVSPYDVNVLNDFGDARLTLTTCNPPFLATTRLIVVAKLAKWLPIGGPVPLAPATARARRSAPTSPARSSPATTSRVTALARRSAGSSSGLRRSAASSLARSLPVTTASVRATSPVAFARAGSLPAPAPGTAPVRNPSGALATAGHVVGENGVDDTATVGQAMTDEGNGWHLTRLPAVLAVVTALCALGALYQRVTRFFVGASRWLVMAPMWAAGLLVLFKVLGLLLPADL